MNKIIISILVLLNILIISPYAQGAPLDRALPKKFLLVWDHITRTNPDLESERKIEGLDVISPTWFSVLPDGEILSLASAEYVQAAHKKGYQVWALVKNDGFEAQKISLFLNNPKAMDKAVAKICDLVQFYDIDGVNADFEAFSVADRDGYTLFVKKLAAALKAIGRWSSVDVSMVSPWPSSHRYDRRALGEAVDFVMLMAYDEHWRTSPKAGSVASLPWVERGVVAALAEIGASKLVLGVPFYMREWEETPKAGGGVSVKGVTMSMGAAKDTAAKNATAVIWLPGVGQNYMEYHKNNKKYRVWIEDEKSMSMRVNLAHKYGLLGIAAWRKGFELPSIWTELGKFKR